MKLPCSVAIGKRVQSTVPINCSKKYSASTLALCKNPKSSAYFILLFSAQYKNGNKYELKNISKVLTRFVSEGKATIQFKDPPHDLYIQSDPIILKSFLLFLKKASENKLNKQEQISLSMSVTPNSFKPTVKKVVVTETSDYSTKGFPRTVEVLHINYLKRSTLDKGILQLSRLRVLNISYNNIQFLPTELNTLPCLSELNVAHNQLGKGLLKQWSWMGGNFCKTLKTLDLSDNVLVYLPYYLTKLHALVSLHLDHNIIKFIPYGITNLKHLKVLTAANNSLVVLPGSIKTLRLQNLDLCNNNFHNNDNNPAAIFPKPLPVRTLKEYAARSVLHNRLPYSNETLPHTLVYFLDHTVYCVCGKACFSVFIKEDQMMCLTSIAETFYVSPNHSLYVPVECYFCTVKCFGSTHHNRARIPII